MKAFLVYQPKEILFLSERDAILRLCGVFVRDLYVKHVDQDHTYLA